MSLYAHSFFSLRPSLRSCSFHPCSSFVFRHPSCLPFFLNLRLPSFYQQHFLYLRSLFFPSCFLAFSLRRYSLISPSSLHFLLLSLQTFFLHLYPALISFYLTSTISYLFFQLSLSSSFLYFHSISFIFVFPSLSFNFLSFPSSDLPIPSLTAQLYS